MSNDRKFRLRCTYVKQGRLAYLSHLEIARALERCVRRAGLPFGVSQGFSPHMLLQFGSALPVGIGSTCEIFDINLRDYLSPKVALERLQNACVRDLMVQECKYVGNRAKAASVAYPVSTYSVVFNANPTGGISEGCALEFPETITLIKKKKERVMQVDEFLVGEPDLKDREFQFSLVAKPTGSLRPDRLLEATLAKYNEAMLAQYNEVTSARLAQNDKTVSARSARKSALTASECKTTTSECEPLRILSFTRISQREE